MNDLLNSIENFIGHQGIFIKIFLLPLVLIIFLIKSLIQLFILIFLPPQKSFAFLSAQDHNGVWQKSYYEHRKYSHNVRFGSISFTLLAVTTVVAINFILNLIIPISHVEIASAATYGVVNNNDAGPGSFRQALLDAQANPGPDIINVTIAGTVFLNSSLTITNDISITGNNLRLDGSALAMGTPAIVINGSNVNIDNITIQNVTGTGIFIPAVISNLTLSNLLLNNVQNHGIFLANANKVTFSKIKANNVKLAVLNIQNTDDLSITNSEFSNAPTDGGIILDGVTNAQIGNTTFTNLKHGIIVGNNIACQDIILNNLTIIDSANTAIILNNSLDTDVTNSKINIVTALGSGISLKSLSNSDITDNIISGLDLNSGITIDSNSNNNLFQNNNISNFHDGLIFQNSSNNTIRANTIFSNITTGIIVNSNNNLLESNTIYNNNTAIAITNVAATNNTISSNVLHDNDRGVDLKDGNYNIITKNIIYNHPNNQGITLRGGNENLASPIITKTFFSNKLILVEGSVTENKGLLEVFLGNNKGDALTYINESLLPNQSYGINTALFSLNIQKENNSYSWLGITFTDEDNNTSALSFSELIADNEAPTTTVSLASASYTGSQEVTLAAVDNYDENAKIFYTLDGSEPSSLSSLYTEALTISQTTTLKVKAIDFVQNEETTQTFTYTINNETPTDNDEPEALTNFQINNQDITANTEKIRTTDTTPSFKFINFAETYIGSKVKIVLKRLGETVLTLKKEIKRTGRAQITVPDESSLDLGNYKVYTGIVGSYEPTYKVNLEIIDATPSLDQIPQIITNQLLPVISTADKITLSLYDLNNQKIVHSINSESQNGVFNINFPFWPDAGEYQLRAIAETNDVLSDEVTKNIYLTPNEYVAALTTDVHDTNYVKRLFYNDTISLAGLVAEGQTITVNGQPATIKQPCTETCSWYIELTNLPTGINTFNIQYSSGNNIIQTTTYLARRDLPAITPSVVSHENLASFNKAPLLVLIGHANDDLLIYDAYKNLIKTEKIGTDGVYKFNTAPYITYGKNTFNFRARENAKYSSFANFSFYLTRPLSYIAPVATPVTKPIIEPETITPINNEQIIPPVQNEQEVVNEIINKYQQDQINQPPLASELYLTSAKTILNEAQKLALKNLLANYIENKTQISPLNIVDNKLQFTTTQTYTISSLWQMLLGNDVANNNDQLIISGQIPEDQLNNLPAYAIVTIYSDPVVKIAQADVTGKWTMTIPLAMLPQGDHTAFAQTEVNGVKSDQIEIAKFVVKKETKLSQTTWLIIGNVIFVIVIILIAIFLQALKNKKLKLSNQE